MQPASDVTSDIDLDSGPERELKYAVPVSQAAFTAAWLASACQPDRQFAPARVVTVYYDTSHLDLLDEKVNSDFIKTKVRARWYDAGPSGAGDRPVFVEWKHRVGKGREKRRARLEGYRPWTWALDSPGWAALLEQVPESVAAWPSGLEPVLRLSYVRHRFAGPERGTRVTFDTGVRLEAVNPRRVPRAAANGPLDVAILEYKGRADTLPPQLAPVTRFGARRVSYSKYLACMEHATRFRG